MKQGVANVCLKLEISSQRMIGHCGIQQLVVSDDGGFLKFDGNAPTGDPITNPAIYELDEVKDIDDNLESFKITIKSEPETYDKISVWGKLKLTRRNQYYSEEIQNISIYFLDCIDYYKKETSGSYELQEGTLTYLGDPVTTIDPD